VIVSVIVAVRVRSDVSVIVFENVIGNDLLGEMLCVSDTVRDMLGLPELEASYERVGEREGENVMVGVLLMVPDSSELGDDETIPLVEMVIDRVGSDENEMLLDGDSESADEADMLGVKETSAVEEMDREEDSVDDRVIERGKDCVEDAVMDSSFVDVGDGRALVVFLKFRDTTEKDSVSSWDLVMDSDCVTDALAERSMDTVSDVLSDVDTEILDVPDKECVRKNDCDFDDVRLVVDDTETACVRDGLSDTERDMEPDRS